MIRNATLQDKDRIVQVLTDSFTNNKSVEYILNSVSSRKIKNLMNYSFDVCFLFGEVFISDDANCCALILYPDRKKTNLKSIWLDLKLIFSAIGIANLSKVIKREKIISSIQPQQNKFCYLWYIGVSPPFQNNGKGSEMMYFLIDHAKAQNKHIYLETSTEANIAWYKKKEFTIYATHLFSYQLYFLKN